VSLFILALTGLARIYSTKILNELFLFHRQFTSFNWEHAAKPEMAGRGVRPVEGRVAERQRQGRLRWPANRLRLKTPPDSGGSFGAKHAIFPYIVLMAIAAPAPPPGRCQTGSRTGRAGKKLKSSEK
jgi:hypothetical protein